MELRLLCSRACGTLQNIRQIPNYVWRIAIGMNKNDQYPLPWQCDDSSIVVVVAVVVVVVVVVAVVVVVVVVVVVGGGGGGGGE